MRVLTVNSGSSSIRLEVLEISDEAQPRRVSSLHRSGVAAHRSEIDELLSRDDDALPSLVAHRVVHGGWLWSRPTRIDDEFERDLETLIPIAPLHLPSALAWMRVAREVLPATPQVAVFDTGFFAQLPMTASTYALPRDIAQRLHIRRYGFHGLAHGAMWRRWEELGEQGGRLVTLQLGAGCSAAAIADGRPLDTSMGFSPTEGLVMATRSGDVDAGALIHLQRSDQLGPDALERLLNHSSGLLGLSGITGDMAALTTSADPRARLAIAVFTYRVKKYVGAYAAVLNGLDGLVFGGGIGEHSPLIRAACLEGLQHLGIELDAAANLRAVGGEAKLSAPSSAVTVYSVAVDEAGELARQAFAWQRSLTATPEHVEKVELTL